MVKCVTAINRVFTANKIWSLAAFPLNDIFDLLSSAFF